MNNPLNEHHDGSLRDTILKKIETERISMRPRIYFTLQVAAVMVVALLSLVLSILIFNFIVFSIRINSHDAFLQFGAQGLVKFLMFFPWSVLVLDVLMIVLLDWLIRTFRFGYRVPVMYIVGAIVLITCAFGFALDRGTYFNDRLMDRAEHEGLPSPLGGLYHGVRLPPRDGLCRCVITAIDGAVLTVADFRDGATTTYTVLLPSENPHATTTDLKVGDVVFVAGDNDGDGDDVIRAFGVRKEKESGYKQRPPRGSDSDGRIAQ